MIRLSVKRIQCLADMHRSGGVNKAVGFRARRGAMGPGAARVSAPAAGGEPPGYLEGASPPPPLRPLATLTPKHPEVDTGKKHQHCLLQAKLIARNISHNFSSQLLSMKPSEM